MSSRVLWRQTNLTHCVYHLQALLTQGSLWRSLPSPLIFPLFSTLEKMLADSHKGPAYMSVLGLLSKEIFTTLTTRVHCIVMSPCLEPEESSPDYNSPVPSFST